jgi:DNA-binding response OmpR family regulator
MRKALVVEDDADIVELVSLYLTKDGWVHRRCVTRDGQGTPGT